MLAVLLCVTVMLPACAAANNDGASGTIGVSVQQKAGGVTDFFAKVKAFFENIIHLIKMQLISANIKGCYLCAAYQALLRLSREKQGLHCCQQE